MTGEKTVPFLATRGMSQNRAKTFGQIFKHFVHLQWLNWQDKSQNAVSMLQYLPIKDRAQLIWMKVSQIDGSKTQSKVQHAINVTQMELHDKHMLCALCQQQTSVLHLYLDVSGIVYVLLDQQPVISKAGCCFLGWESETFPVTESDSTQNT